MSENGDYLRRLFRNHGFNEKPIRDKTLEFLEQDFIEKFPDEEFSHFLDVVVKVCAKRIANDSGLLWQSVSGEVAFDIYAENKVSVVDARDRVVIGRKPITDIPLALRIPRSWHDYD